MTGHVAEVVGHVLGAVVYTAGAVVVLELVKAAWLEHFVRHHVHGWLLRLMNRLHGSRSELEPSRINRLMRLEGRRIELHDALARQPVLDFKQELTEPLVVDAAQARAHAEQQAAAGRPDDPHAVVSNDRYDRAANRELLSVTVVERYSELRADARREQRLILGATNLVILNDTRTLLMHQRAPWVDSGSNMLHAFGGGYLPYRPSDPVGKHTRRDDRKSLLVTASRELAEESGIFSFDHVRDLLLVLEERWPVGEGKLGHLTYAFFLPFNQRRQLAYAQVVPNLDEGLPIPVPIGDGQLLVQMIVDGTVQISGKSYAVHPQFRALLYGWIQLGMPGLALHNRLPGWRGRGINPGRLQREIDGRIDLATRREPVAD